MSVQQVPTTRKPGTDEGTRRLPVFTYSPVPHPAYESLSQRARDLLGILHKGPAGFRPYRLVIDPTDEELAQQTGWSSRTIRRAVRELVEAGFLDRRRRHGRRYLTRRYKLAGGKMHPSDKTGRTYGQKCPIGAVALPIRGSKEPSTTSSSRKREPDDDDVECPEQDPPPFQANPPIAAAEVLGAEVLPTVPATMPPALAPGTAPAVAAAAPTPPAEGINLAGLVSDQAVAELAPGPELVAAIAAENISPPELAAEVVAEIREDKRAIDRRIQGRWDFLAVALCVVALLRRLAARGLRKPIPSPLSYAIGIVCHTYIPFGIDKTGRDAIAKIRQAVAGKRADPSRQANAGPRAAPPRPSPEVVEQWRREATTSPDVSTRQGAQHNLLRHGLHWEER